MQALKGEAHKQPFISFTRSGLYVTLAFAAVGPDWGKRFRSKEFTISDNFNFTRLYDLSVTGFMPCWIKCGEWLPLRETEEQKIWMTRSLLQLKFRKDRSRIGVF